MIAFKDFTAARDGWFAGHTLIDEVVGAMNDWLADHPVDVVNIETVHVGKRGVFHGIRLWYKVAP